MVGVLKNMTNQSFSRIWILIIIIYVAGGILAWQYWQVKRKVKTSRGEVPMATPLLIGPTAVWDCEEKREEWLEKWHGCEGNLDCISGVMKKYGASSDAINFTKLLSEPGFLYQFQEMGKIDIGIAAFPDRANTNEVYYLLNGSPPLISTEISQREDFEEIMKKVEQDPLYAEMKEKYPNIEFLGIAPQFTQRKILPNNNERFIFTYGLVNGCRICYTEYSAEIGFDFDSEGKFLKPIFLQIVKESNFNLPLKNLKLFELSLI